MTDIRLHTLTDENNLGRLSKIYNYYSGTKIKDVYKTYGITKVGEVCLKIVYSYTGDDITGEFASLDVWTQEMEDGSKFSNIFSNELSTSFDGVNDTVDFGDNHNYDLGDTFSISLWVKPITIALTGNIFSKTGPAGGYNGYMLRCNATTGALYLQVRATGATRNWTYDKSLVAGSWHHIVFTYSGALDVSGMELYVDGVKATTPTAGGLSGTLLIGQPFQLASRNSSNYFNCNIDEMSIWNTELSQSDVTALYNNGVVSDISALDNYTAECDSWYRMGDDDTYPTVTDNKGTTDGTMTNMAAEDFVNDVPE